MDYRSTVRASDKERQAAADRLRNALDEGRLGLQEYDDRLAGAYRAVTYGDLAALFVDLPQSDALVVDPQEPVAGRQPDGSCTEPTSWMPTTLRTLWASWAVIVFINLLVWAMISLTSFEFTYFWPAWVAGPAGVALLCVTIGVRAGRRVRTVPGRGH